MVYLIGLLQATGDPTSIAGLFIQAGFVGIFALFVLYLRRLEAESAREWRQSSEKQQAEQRDFYYRIMELVSSMSQQQSQMFREVTKENVAGLKEVSLSLGRLTDQVSRNTEAIIKYIGE